MSPGAKHDVLASFGRYVVFIIGFFVLLISSGLRADPSKDAARIRAELDAYATELEKAFDSIERLLVIDEKALKRRIQLFKQSDDEELKLELAAWIYSDARRATQPPNSIKFSEDEQRVIKLADDEIKNLYSRMSAFESSLSPKEVALITRDNPHSVYRKMNRLLMFSSQVCDEQEYLRLKSKYGLEELYTRGPNVMRYVAANESKYSTAFAKRALEFIRSKSELSESARLPAMGYRLMIRINAEVGDTQRDDGAVKDARQQLLNKGVKQSELEDYVLSMASVSPACLAKYSVPFAHALKADLTKTRGEFLLSELVKAIKLKNTRIKNLSDLQMKKGDGVLAETLDDADYNPYKIEYGANSVSLRSEGRKPDDPSDDIVIGPVAINLP